MLPLKFSFGSMVATTLAAPKLLFTAKVVAKAVNLPLKLASKLILSGKLIFLGIDEPAIIFKSCLPETTLMFGKLYDAVFAFGKPTILKSLCNTVFLPVLTTIFVPFIFFIGPFICPERVVTFVLFLKKSCLIS